MQSSTQLSHQLRGVDAPGYSLLPGFADATVTSRMRAEMVALARAEAAGGDIGDAIITRETQPEFAGEQPEDFVAKVFRLHRRGPFRDFFADARITGLLTEAIGPDVDCFLSQFIFKNPGAWGQPWHQDSYYFPFEPARPIVGLWLAITEATLDNGCLHVLPGSQCEPVHVHVKDQRPGAQYGYVEIVDHDMQGAEACLLQPGDLMLFDSHLMHRSTDNLSQGIRAAMVWHCAQPGTVERGLDLGNGRIEKSRLHDWMPVVRNGVAVLARF